MSPPTLEQSPHNETPEVTNTIEQNLELPDNFGSTQDAATSQQTLMKQNSSVHNQSSSAANTPKDSKNQQPQQTLEQMLNIKE